MAFNNSLINFINEKMAHSFELSTKTIIQVLLFAGTGGFCLGAFGNPTWHQFLEYSQIISGTVNYPKETSFYYFHAKLWSFWIQVFAVFMHFGIPERVLVFLASGIWGMLSFQALSIGVLCLSQNRFLSVIAPFFIYFAKAINFGVIYPIWLMGEYPSVGGLGLSYVFLVVGLIGCARYKIGALLLGMAPAFHSSLSMLLWVTTFLVLLWDWKNLGFYLKQTIWYFLLGVLICLGSFFIQKEVSPIALSLNSEILSQYYYGFGKFWDSHRAPAVLTKPGIFLAIFSFGVTLFWVLRFYKDLPKNALFFLRFIAVSSALGLMFSVLSWMPSTFYPRSLHIAMPGRWINFSILAFPVLLIGLFGRYKENWWSQLFLICFLIGLLIRPIVTHTIPLWIFMILFSILLILSVVLFKRNSMLTMLSISSFLTAIALSLFLHKGLSPNLLSLRGALQPIGIGFFLLIIVLLLFYQVGRFRLEEKSVYYKNIILLFVSSLIVSIVAVQSFISWKKQNIVVPNKMKDPFFAAVAHGKGLILTGSNVAFIQLRSRRPILIDADDLDGALTYAPETGPEVERILRQVYGVDLLNPSDDLKKARRGGLLNDSGKLLWESRTSEQWKKIREDFGVTDIVCYKEWKLNLPKLSSNNEYVLYAIP